MPEVVLAVMTIRENINGTWLLEISSLKSVVSVITGKAAIFVDFGAKDIVA